VTHPIIATGGLGKSYGSTVALADVDLVVAQGTILGLLGRNGAGKTTLVRILATLLPPDTGWAQIAGAEVVRDAARVRSFIGLAGQFAAVDECLTGLENLELVAACTGCAGATRACARGRSSSGSGWRRSAVSLSVPTRAGCVAVSTSAQVSWGSRWC
jgi:ABC-type multidrug transport system ATPase subunit